MLENVIPRLLGWVPISWRRALIGRPDKPSRVATLTHDILNRISPRESQVYLWLLLGILFRLPSLALSAQYAATSQTPAAAQNFPAYASRMR